MFKYMEKKTNDELTIDVVRLVFILAIAFFVVMDKFFVSAVLTEVSDQKDSSILNFWYFKE